MKYGGLFGRGKWWEGGAGDTVIEPQDGEVWSGQLEERMVTDSPGKRTPP